MKMGDFAPTQSFLHKFQVEGVALDQSFCTVSYAIECLTTMSLAVFTQRNFVADVIQSKCDFKPKQPFCVLSLLGRRGLRGNYDDHLMLVGKCAVDFFLLVLIELFSLSVTAEALRANIGSKSAISFLRVPVDPKFQVEAVAPPTILFLRKLG